MERRISLEPVHPGEYLADELEARGWTQDDLAEVLGRSRNHINRLVQGKTAVTPESAHELAKAFGTSAELWMNLQVSYELAAAAKENRDIERKAKVYVKAPIRDLVKRGWLPPLDGVEDMENKVCKFLKIPTIDAESGLKVAARKSTSYVADTPAQIAWFRRAEQLRQCVGAAAYKDDAFPDLVSELKKLAAYPEDARRVPKLLADFGVRLVLLEHLPKTKIAGGALWLDQQSPVVALTLWFDRIDNFWHTLMHELIHVRDRDEPAVDSDMMGDDQELPSVEQKANAEACNYLIPKEKLDSFIVRHKPLYYQTKVVQFAQARGVHPGIVVGQLQHRKEIDWQQLRKLLVKIRHEVIGQT